MRIILLYFPSKYIVDYISNHRIDWSDPKLAGLGGDGDKTGTPEARTPPTSSVQEFLALLAERKDLFTQEEYWKHCAQKWSDWIDRCIAYHQRRKLLGYEIPRIPDGLRAKAYRNFYPSMIDSLHVWAMLCETGQFQQCVLDSFEDTVSKSDITVSSNGKPYRIALIGPTSTAAQNRQYKKDYRDGYDDADTIMEVQMTLDRPRNPGNKRWYHKEDFSRLLGAVTAPQYTKTQTQSMFPDWEEHRSYY